MTLQAAQVVPAGDITEKSTRGAAAQLQPFSQIDPRILIQDKFGGTLLVALPDDHDLECGFGAGG